MSLKSKKANGKGSPAPSAGNAASVNGWQDDEYAQIIEGVKRIYNAKIRPLEVTYNFEGFSFRLASLKHQECC